MIQFLDRPRNVERYPFKRFCPLKDIHSVSVYLKGVLLCTSTQRMAVLTNGEGMWQGGGQALE